MPSSVKIIQVGARDSPLSKVQVQEVLNELQQHCPEVQFETTFLKSTGDLQKHVSLRALGKTDFFTKEIDELVSSGRCQVGIHSAKDLPEPLPKGLSLICLTKGVDSSDVLVLPKGMKLQDLPSKSLIATSSERREESVKQLRSDLSFCDLRGTIGERLDKLARKEVAGVVLAEAAIIRLGLTHLNRITLPGATTPGQGQLAILARKEDREMRELFSLISIF